MEGGKYANDNYINHFELSSNTLCMITAKRLMVIKRSIIYHQWEVGWSEEWSNCAKVAQSSDRMKIKITLKVSNNYCLFV